MNPNKNIELITSSWIFQQLKQQPKLLKNLFLYHLIATLLSLSIPLISQSFVTLLSQGIIIQPLLILTIILISAMVFLIILKIADHILIERVQKRLFVTFFQQWYAFQQEKLKNSKENSNIINDDNQHHHHQEKKLYFFELFILKKGLAKLLLNVPTTILVFLVGFILLPFYSPYLIIIDALILLGFATIYFFGKGFVKIGIKESGRKYQLLHFLQNHFPTETALDNAMNEYATYRQSHFSILVRQFLAGYILQVTVLVATLALGTYLVSHQEMSIGQLIATELLVIAMLNTLDKTIDLFETFSDVCIADYKLQHLLSE